jgi:hypothetical protein
VAAVADHRHGVARERRPDELAGLAVADRLAGVRVHALDEEVVGPHVHAVLLGALAGHAGTEELAHAVLVEGVE